MVFIAVEGMSPQPFDFSFFFTTLCSFEIFREAL